MIIDFLKVIVWILAVVFLVIDVLYTATSPNNMELIRGSTARIIFWLIAASPAIFFVLRRVRKLFPHNLRCKTCRTIYKVDYDTYDRGKATIGGYKCEACQMADIGRYLCECGSGRYTIAHVGDKCYECWEPECNECKISITRKQYVKTDGLCETCDKKLFEENKDKVYAMCPAIPVIAKKMRTKPGKEKFVLYTLEQEGGHYYIGIASNFRNRMVKHFIGKGSEWTKTHKPIKPISVILLPERITTGEAAETYEDMLTIQLMNKHGVQRVRGGKFSAREVQYVEKSLNKLGWGIKGSDVKTTVSETQSNYDRLISELESFEDLAHNIEQDIVRMREKTSSVEDDYDDDDDVSLQNENTESASVDKSDEEQPTVSQQQEQSITDDAGICSACSSTLTGDGKFCIMCGMKVIPKNVKVCPSCKREATNEKFCMECGTSLTGICQKCNTEVSPGGKFCLECGHKVA